MKGLKLLLAQFPEIDAVFACNDHIALGVLKAAKDMGLKVPEDVSVIGCDGMPLTESSIPRLSTILFPIERIAAATCKIVLDRIEHPEKPRKKRIRISPELLIRESTAPVRKE